MFVANTGVVGRLAMVADGMDMKKKPRKMRVALNEKRTVGRLNGSSESVMALGFRFGWGHNHKTRFTFRYDHPWSRLGWVWFGPVATR